MTTEGTRGKARRIQDGRLAQEGTFWSNRSHALVLKEENAHLRIDLGGTRNVGALVIQADKNDTYAIEASLDGEEWVPLWLAPPVNTEDGLRTRHTRLDTPRPVRYLRVEGRDGDGYYSISELRAYCEPPDTWPPKLQHPPPKTGWDAIDNSMMVGIKGGLATAGTLLLLWWFLLQKQGRSREFRRTRHVLLAVLGLASFASWWNLGHFHFDHYIHTWEHYHYYIGAKYAPELGFERIYDCTAVADMQDGKLQQVKDRKIRNLQTNELEPSDRIVENPEACTKHFSKERWAQFRKDIRFFRSRFSAHRWDQSQHDHGYNATPVWTIMGRILASGGTATWDTVVTLGIIDSGLLIAMWMAVWWAFGWQTMCVALIYWGTNFPARYYWNGGSFLRMDWLFFLVLGICLLRKAKMASGGLAMTYSTLLRIFPGFAVIPLILQALTRMVRERRIVLSREHTRFAAGCIVAMAVLIPVSGWATGGLHSWADFAENSAKHMKTALTNNMGFKTVVAYDFDTRAIHMRNDDLDDPFAEWKEARNETFESRSWLFYGLLVGFLVLVARAVERRELWIAAALGTGVIVMSAELTCYYYSFLLAFGLLWEKRQVSGIAINAFAALSCLYPSIWGWNDDHFAAMSLTAVIAVAGVTAYFAFVSDDWETKLLQPAGGGAQPTGNQDDPPPQSSTRPAGRSRRKTRPGRKRARSK